MSARLHAPLSPRHLPDGTHTVAFQGALFQEPPFAELAEWYDVRLHPVDARRQTVRNHSSYLRQALEWLRAKGVERPGTATWKEYLDWRQHPSCPARITDTTADSHRAVLQRVYVRCASAPKPGWIHVPNPLDPAFLPPYRKAAARDRPRSIADPYVTVPQLVAAMPDPLARALPVVLRWTGLRIQEVLAIPLPGGELDHRLGGRLLNLDAGTLTVAKQRTRDQSWVEDLKTDFSRATIQLPEPAGRALREALRWRSEKMLRPGRRVGTCAAWYVFPYYRLDLDRLMAIHRTVSPLDFPKRVRGVDGGDAWHVYRHTFATEHARNGVSPEHLHKLLRHRRRDTTDAYLRALLVDVVRGEDVDLSIQRQLDRQNQALAERSGKGLTLVQSDRRNDR